MITPPLIAPDQTRRRLIAGAAGLAVAGFTSADSFFAPDPKAIERWRPAPAQPGAEVDHGPWADLLARRRIEGGDGIARVRYAAFTAADRRQLDEYLDALGRIDAPRLERNRQFAFWINLYNAVCVRTVLSRYPVRSIQDIDTSPGLFSSGPWKAPAVAVGGQEMSLDDIEHGVLRPFFQDARLHYAVNCAAAGCPNLRGEPYLAERLDAQLDAQARAFVNHPRAVAFDAENRLVVSKIYGWFCDDFGKGQAGVLAHLQRYAAPDLAGRLAKTRRIDETRYDWALNDAA